MPPDPLTERLAAKTAAVVDRPGTATFQYSTGLHHEILPFPQSRRIYINRDPVLPRFTAEPRRGHILSPEFGSGAWTTLRVRVSGAAVIYMHQGFGGTDSDMQKLIDNLTARGWELIARTGVFLRNGEMPLESGFLAVRVCGDGDALLFEPVGLYNSLPTLIFAAVGKASLSVTETTTLDLPLPVLAPRQTADKPGAETAVQPGDSGGKADVGANDREAVQRLEVGDVPGAVRLEAWKQAQSFSQNEVVPRMSGGALFFPVSQSDSGYSAGASWPVPSHYAGRPIRFQYRFSIVEGVGAKAWSQLHVCHVSGGNALRACFRMDAGPDISSACATPPGLVKFSFDANRWYDVAEIFDHGRYSMEVDGVPVLGGTYDPAVEPDEIRFYTTARASVMISRVGISFKPAVPADPGGVRRDAAAAPPDVTPVQLAQATGPPSKAFINRYFGSRKCLVRTLGEAEPILAAASTLKGKVTSITGPHPEYVNDGNLDTGFGFTDSRGNFTIECDPPVFARGLVMISRLKGLWDDIIEDGNVIINDKKELSYKIAHWPQNSAFVLSFGRSVEIQRLKVECLSGVWHPGIREVMYVK